MSTTKKPATDTSDRQVYQIEYLVNEYYSYIHRLAQSILDDPYEAEDAAQDTFIAANRTLHEFRAEAHIKTWLSSIVINNCRGRIRKRKIRLAFQNSLVALHVQQKSSISIESIAEVHEVDRQIWQAVDSLDEKHRLPVLLRYVHQMSVPEIAETLDVNEGTIYSRLHYARFALQARLGILNSGEEVPDEPIIPR